MKKREYSFSDDLGDANILVHEVFPGVQLAYHSVHMDQLELGFLAEGTMIEIHHCREGRIEQAFENEFFYLMPGDLSIAMRKKMVKAFHFPLRHYHGISIGIHMDQVSGTFAQLLEEMKLRPLEMTQKLCGDKNCFIARGERYIEHIFSELYTVPEGIQEGYFKLKILELLLVLSGADLYRHQLPECAMPKAYVRLANQAAAYFSEHMDQRVTIGALAKQLGVSQTQLKNAFRGVYGVPVFSYMRIQKMQSAAQWLIHTEKSVGEIAYELGYSNTGKFSAAFQAIMGDTPGDYRKQHTKLRRNGYTD